MRRRGGQETSDSPSEDVDTCDMLLLPECYATATRSLGTASRYSLVKDLLLPQLDYDKPIPPEVLHQLDAQLQLQEAPTLKRKRVNHLLSLVHLCDKYSSREQCDADERRRRDRRAKRQQQSRQLDHDHEHDRDQSVHEEVDTASACLSDNTSSGGVDEIVAKRARHDIGNDEAPLASSFKCNWMVRKQTPNAGDSISMCSCDETFASSEQLVDHIKRHTTAELLAGLSLYYKAKHLLRQSSEHQEQTARTNEF